MRPRTLFGASMGSLFLACVASVRRPAPASVSVADAAAPLVEAASTSAPPQPLAYAEAIRRFPEMAAFPRPQELSEVEWLKGVETVRLWVDRSELWPGAPRGCSVYAFHRDRSPAGRDGSDWIAPRPRAGAPDAVLRLRSYARLEAGDDAEVFGHDLIVLPDRLAYTGVGGHLGAECLADEVTRRPGCFPLECRPCARIRFYDVTSEPFFPGRGRFSSYHVVVASDLSCAPCDPGPGAADLPLAKATAAATHVLLPFQGPIFFRTAAGCAQHLREPLDDP